MDKTARSAAIILLVALTAAIGCDGAATADVAHSSGVETDDGVEVAWTRGPGVWGVDPIDAEVFFSVGVLDGEAEYLFGQVAGVAADAAGRVYVLDHLASAVRVYDTAGAHLTTIGRPGEGPGEFQHPFGLALAPHGDLLVRDLTRVSRFAPLVPDEVPTQYAGSWRGLLYPPRWNLTERITVDDEYLHPRDIHREGDPSRYVYVRFSAAGEELDTIHVPPFPDAPPAYAWYRTGPGGGLLLSGLNHPPFLPLPTWDATPRGTVLSGDGSTYEIRESGAQAEVIRRIERRGVTMEQIPTRERSDSLAAMRARLDSIPVPLDAVQGLHEDVRAGRAPEIYPFYIGLHAAPDGWIWVERWPIEGRSRFDVFSERGRFLGTIRLPIQLDRDVKPYFTREAVYGVTSDAELGVQRVVGFRFATR